MKSNIKILLFLFLLPSLIVAQNNDAEPNPFDYGKMWTFENPPTEWFKEAYDFEANQEWFDYVRKSSLRFATWCSASFISPDGLIMTNHHCSRDVVGALQQEGENFDKEGFYAENLADERKADGLFVEQLIMTKDITDEVKAAMNRTPSVDDPLQYVQDQYASKADWEGLRLQLVTYYSGGKYSLYGYKRYDDIRLVWIPEVDLGFFGGDPDNFTYPRYNLDCTFWRAYDENGIPLNTSDNYLSFNPSGAQEGEPVFVVGNPGRTERYRTVAQLKYDRDYRFPITYQFLKNRNEMMMEEYYSIVDDPEKEFEAQAMLNQIANVANGMKAYGGITKGLKDDDLFGRKVAMENYIKSKSPGVTYWDELESEYEKLNPHGWAVSTLRPSPLKGKIYQLMNLIHQYEKSIGNVEEAELSKLSDQILGLTEALNNPKDQRYFKVFLQEIQDAISDEDDTLDKILKGQSVDDYTAYLAKKSTFGDKEKTEKLLSDPKHFNKKDDPLQFAARTLGNRYQQASDAFQASAEKRKDLEEKIANQAFKVFGTSLPPDATFTLRISDGVVKGYNYNGTEAPVFTTFFGLYDRYYSHGEEFPWSLPERWLNPPMELLKSKMNMISTNDIIGGNSGSPLINKNREAVGLIFDGNIESLPGNFIFDEAYNRTVSVHAEGIYNALKYIYKGDRIIAELDKK